MEVSLDCKEDFRQPLLLDGTELSCGVGVDTSLINTGEDGRALTVLSNHTGCSVTVDEGSSLGVAVPIEPVEPAPGGLQLPEPGSKSRPSSPSQPTPTAEPARLSCLHSKPERWRKKKLAESVDQLIY